MVTERDAQILEVETVVCSFMSCADTASWLRYSSQDRATTCQVTARTNQSSYQSIDRLNGMAV